MTDDYGKDEFQIDELPSEEKLKRAGMYGKQLLLQVSQLQAECEKLSRQLAAKEQTIYELKGQLELKTAMEASWREEVEVMRSELAQVKEDRDACREDMRRYENQIQSMLRKENQKNEKAQMEIEEIRKQSEEKIASLIAEIAEFEDRRKDAASYSNDSFSSNSSATVELTEAREEKDDALRQLKVAQGRERQLTDCLNETKSRLQELQDVAKSREEQISFLKEQLECIQGERAAMAAEIEVAKASGAGGGYRGNSLFSELEDRRVKAEHMLVVQREKYNELEQRYLDKLREIQDFKDEFVSRLAARRHGGSSATETQVRELSARIVELESQVSSLKLERDRNNRRHEADLRQQIELESAFAPTLRGAAATSGGSSGNVPGAQHYESVIRAKEQQVVEMNQTIQQQVNELVHLRESKRMALTNSVRLERDLRESEGLNMKLKFQMQGLREEIDLLRSGDKSQNAKPGGSSGTNCLDRSCKVRGSYNTITPSSKLADETGNSRAGMSNASLLSSKSKRSSAKELPKTETRRSDKGKRIDAVEKIAEKDSELSVCKPVKMPVLKTVNFDSPDRPQLPKSLKPTSQTLHEPPSNANQDENCKQM